MPITIIHHAKVTDCSLFGLDSVFKLGYYIKRNSFSFGGRTMSEERKEQAEFLSGGTVTFSIANREQEMRVIVKQVYESLKEKGYNPVNQIVGYLLSEDPTYITTHNNARALIRKVDRDELLRDLLKNYVGD